MFRKNKEGTEIFLRNGGEEAQMLIEESKSRHVQTHRHSGKWLIQGNSACTETAAKMNGTKPAPRFA
ncbi:MULTISPECIES: hypothetical protein [Novosphingobium]|uniref:hypothetical protein n=1 Tax=Novosphingobium TaxID=165696 RepID=UPI0011AB603E|nr:MULTISPECIES: hypothetical protein [Novosphingobium]